MCLTPAQLSLALCLLTLFSRAARETLTLGSRHVQLYSRSDTKRWILCRNVSGAVHVSVRLSFTHSSRALSADLMHLCFVILRAFFWGMSPLFQPWVEPCDI